MDSFALWSVQQGFQCTSSLHQLWASLVLLVLSIWNRSHICFIPVLKTEQFSKYASLTRAAVCHLTSTLCKLYKSTNILLNCCSTWGSSNDTGTPQKLFYTLSEVYIKSTQSTSNKGSPPPALQTQLESCSVISFSCITTSSEDHASQMKSLLYHHDPAASSETVEGQLIKAQETKRRFQLILSYVGLAGLTRQKAVNAYCSNWSQQLWMKIKHRTYYLVTKQLYNKWKNCLKSLLCISMLKLSTVSKEARYELWRQKAPFATATQIQREVNTHDWSK